MIAGIILPLGGRDPARAVALAGMLAILTGLMILLAGVARLGFVTELLSRPVQLGYLYRIAIPIMWASRCCSAARWASLWWRWPTPRCCRNR